jgi:hypothetical protein
MMKVILGVVCTAGIAIAGLFVYKSATGECPLSGSCSHSCPVSTASSEPCGTPDSPVASEGGCCASASRAALVSAEKPGCCAQKAVAVTTPAATEEACGACNKGGACCKEGKQLELIVAPREVK